MIKHERAVELFKADRIGGFAKLLVDYLPEDEKRNLYARYLAEKIPGGIRGILSNEFAAYVAARYADDENKGKGLGMRTKHKLRYTNWFSRQLSV